MKTLYPHQQQALTYLSKRFGGLLFMEMRLGKNLTMLRHLESLGIHDDVLVVTDFGAMRSWELELEDEGEKVTVLSGNRKQRLSLLRQATSGYVISNYESAKRLDLHKAKNWKVIILDETIKIANPKAIVTKYFLSAFKDVRLKYVLNGKPMPENQMQLCCQFLFVHNLYMGCNNFWQYRAKYYEQDFSGFDWKPKGSHVKDTHEYVHEHAFIQTRKDANIGPDKIVTQRIVQQSPAQVKAMKELAKYFEYDGVEYVNDLGLQIGLSYMAGGLSPSENHDVICNNKINAVIHLIKNELDDNKILIWCRFRAEQDYIMKCLAEANIEALQVNGGMTKKQRDEQKWLFENVEGYKCMVLTIASSAKGQDWSVSNTSIYYSHEWSNDFQSQSEDRLVHIKKKDPVLIIHLITENSVDEDVMLGLRNKEFNSKLVMGNFLKRYK